MSSVTYLKQFWNADRGQMILEVAKHKTKNLTLNSDDSDFYYAFLQVGQYILTYCNRLNLPEGLDMLIPQMLVDVLKRDWYATLAPTGYDPEFYGASYSNGGNVSSIKEGDTQISYSSSSNGSDGGSSLESHTANLDEWMYNYNSQLLQYRQLYKF